MSIEEIIEKKLRDVLREELEPLKAELRAQLPSPTAPAPATLLTVAQAAELTGFAERTIRKWINTKRLRALRSPEGREYRIRREDLEKCLAEDPEVEVDVQAEAAKIVAALNARR